MAIDLGLKIDRNSLVVTATTCFILIIAGAIVSIVGMLDAFLAADLFVFNAMSDMHSAVFGLCMAVISIIGFSAAMRVTADDERQAANTQLHAGVPASINQRLDAARIQAMLHVLQYPVRIDGIFGPETMKGVREFQQDHDMLMDGVVGPLTLEALQKEVEFHGRSDWVMEILYRRNAPQQESAPVLSLISAQRRPA